MDGSTLRSTKQLDYPYFPFRIPVDYVLVSRIDNLSKQTLRTSFEKSCKKEGLIVNHEVTGKICFTLISAPFHRLCRESEKSQLSFALKDCAFKPQRPAYCSSLYKLLFGDETEYCISMPFQRKFSHLFHNYTNEKLFFNSADRAKLVHQILTRIDINQFIEEKKTENKHSSSSIEEVKEIDETLKQRGLEHLLLEDVYEEAFILHEPSEVEPYFKRLKEDSVLSFLEAISEIDDDPRKQISDTWSKFYKPQPLDKIRDYFGEEIAFYFAWHGTFITLLWPAVVLGLIAVTYGMIKNIKEEPLIIANCTSTKYLDVNSMITCPQYDSSQRLFSKIWRWFMMSFDNEFNAFYAAFVSIWGSFFYQIWKRNNSVLSFRWNTEDFQNYESDRPEYVGHVLREDVITRESEWITPTIIIFFKMIISYIVVGLCMLIVVISVFCVIVFKMWAIHTFGCDRSFTWQCSIVTTIIPSVLNTSSTMLLSWVYGQVVIMLNDWENHRTNSEHHNALIIKIFAFQMINNYTSLFYIAFIRPESNLSFKAEKMGFQSNGLFGLGTHYKDTCLETTCSMSLAVQLITNLLLKPVPKFIQDIIIPFIVLLYKKAKMKQTKVSDNVPQTDETNVLSREWVKPDAGQFTLWEFNEKIILLGTTMMFAALFPLAPLISLVIGIVDLRIDAHRLLWFNRRPIPQFANGIGIWLPILSFLQYAAVLTNAFIVAFTSDFCINFYSQEKCTIKDRLVIVIVFQNMVFILKYVMQSLIPDVPSYIKVIKRKRRCILYHVIEKGDLPHKLKQRKRARKAKIAWIASRVKGTATTSL